MQGQPPSAVRRSEAPRSFRWAQQLLMALDDAGPGWLQ